MARREIERLTGVDGLFVIGEAPSGLTTREVEVLRFLARWSSNKQIAERLVMARKTVDNHVEHIYTKIGASNRAQASLFVVRNALMTTEDEEFHS